VNFNKYYYTVKYLKPIQIRYQLWYRIRSYWRKMIGFKFPLSLNREGFTILLIPVIKKYTGFEDYQFSYLNQSKIFPKNEIEWNYPVYGKLWTYNLNYFDFLNQAQIKSETGIKLIENYIKNLNKKSIGLEPYPISLRGINWIKFISNIEEFKQCSQQENVTHTTKKKIDSSLYAQYQILLDNLEYHLLANHLLENGFSLLFGAFYFKDKTLYNKAKEIIITQLEEQILADGAHFELSPMYHQIILDRLLDIINLVQNNHRFESQEGLLKQMQAKAHKMLNWLNQMTFSNGHSPLLNDSTLGIGPTTQQLNEYATHLNLFIKNSSNPWPLSESGYRRFNGLNFECIIDIGPIGPTYQPGHAHADTFNFVLNVNNQPFLIDYGISTYETNNQRLIERSTSVHNTVTIKGQNSSEVWSSFRVARRANITLLNENKEKIGARHDGYKRISSYHQRIWSFSKKRVHITDSIEGKFNSGSAYFWLAPNLKPSQKDQTIETKLATLSFKNAKSVVILPTQIPDGYNCFIDSNKIKVKFKDHLETTIQTILK